MKISQKLWSLECSQVFSTIWPTDLVFDPGRSIFELDLVWLRLDQNCGLYGVHKVFLCFDLLTYFLTWDDPYSILTKFDKDWTKTVAPRVFKRFFYDLTYWPSFWPRMIHIQSWLSLIKIGPKLWPLECSQGFSMICPTDLVFDQRSPIFELDWDIVKMIILSKFDEDWTKTLASRVFTRFFHDLTYWPSFWPNIIHIRTWLRYCSFWASMIKIGPKLWPQECSQGFSMIWPTDLVFDPTSPIFQLNWDIVRMIILSKFDEDWTKTVASRVFTKFFHDLTYWPSFWFNITHIRNLLRYCQDDHSEQVWWRLDQNYGL